MSKRLTLTFLVRDGDEPYKAPDGGVRLRSANGADFPLLLAAQLGQCQLEGMTSVDTADEPQTGLFG